MVGIVVGRIWNDHTATLFQEYVCPEILTPDYRCGGFTSKTVTTYHKLELRLFWDSFPNPTRSLWKSVVYCSFYRTKYVEKRSTKCATSWIVFRIGDPIWIKQLELHICMPVHANSCVIITNKTGILEGIPPSQTHPQPPKAAHRKAPGPSESPSLLLWRPTRRSNIYGGLWCTGVLCCDVMHMHVYAM